MSWAMLLKGQPHSESDKDQLGNAQDRYGPVYRSWHRLLHTEPCSHSCSWPMHQPQRPNLYL